MARREFSPMVYAEIVRRAMDEKLPCLVDGCDGDARRSARGSRGWCVAHYTRWRRHGDPLFTQNTPKGEARNYYETVVLSYDGDDCLIWPYLRTSSGYGLLYNPSGSDRVSRALCEEINGSPPTEEDQAAHSCGNGHLGCVTRKHLSWKTPKDNQADRLEHGTNLAGSSHPMAKLNDDDVRKIRSLGNVFTHRALGKMFGVCRVTIGNILLGKNWSSVS
jgi:hypothetical protein